MNNCFIKDSSKGISLREILIKNMEEEKEDKIELNQSISQTSRLLNNNPQYSEIIEFHLMLDSFLKLRNSDTLNGEFNWQLSINNQSSIEAIGIYGKISNIVSIQIGSFYIPILEDTIYMDPISVAGQNPGVTYTLHQNNTSSNNEPSTMIRQDGDYGQYPYSILLDNTTYRFPWINNPLSQIPFANKISIQIKETGQQSYSNYNDVRYNFEFIAVPHSRTHGNPNFIELIPCNGDNWDEYKFIIPINNLTTISMVFRNPDYPIKFEPDIYYGATIDGHFTALPFPQVYIILRTPIPHKLLAGDRIYLRNFIPYYVTDKTKINEDFPKVLLYHLLRIEGHTVNSLVPGLGLSLDPGTPIPTAFEFGLDPAIKVERFFGPDELRVVSNSLPGTIDIIIAKRRLRIPMKIKCLKQ